MIFQVIAIPDDDVSPLSEQELKKNGKDPTEKEQASNGDLSKGFKENEADEEKKSPEGGEEAEMKDPEEGTKSPCFTHAIWKFFFFVFKSF